MNTQEAKQQLKDLSQSGKADKAKGHAKEIIGSAKEKIGSLIGDRELEAKGHLQNAEGKTDRLKGEIKEKIEDAKDTVKAGVELVKEKINEAKQR